MVLNERNDRCFVYLINLFRTQQEFLPQLFFDSILSVICNKRNKNCLWFKRLHPLLDRETKVYPLRKIASIFEDACLVELYCRGIQATSVFESKITQKCFQEMSSHFYLCVVNDIHVIEKLFLLEYFLKISHKNHIVQLLKRYQLHVFGTKTSSFQLS